MKLTFSAYVTVLALAAPALAQGVGSVYTQTNAPSGNAVRVYHRAQGGQIAFGGTFSTGGSGNGLALGSQGSVTVSDDGHWLLVTNAGSNDVSVFATGQSGLFLFDVEPSGGSLPISVAQRGSRVYVLNAGSNPSVSAFEFADGNLELVGGAPAALSSAQAQPAQVGIGPGGAQVFVTEKGTQQIAIFPIQPNGSLGAAAFLPSAGVTPFGFGFAPHDTLIVSEAFGGVVDASAVSSYRIAGLGLLNVVTPSLATTETAACWIVVTGNGRYTYATNTGSGTITGYRILHPTGELHLLDADGTTGDMGPNAHPIDEALSRDSRYLYVLSAVSGEIAGFRVASDGSLEKIQTITGVPATAAGLGAR